jgi:uncharacterized protein involved in propanediol utilization
MSENLGKVSIEELEKIVDQTDGLGVEVLPSGEVLRLNVTEIMEKELRLERERNKGLLVQIERLRDTLKSIHKLSEPT